VAYVQLVYGRQLQQPADETPADPLDVASMSPEQRDALKRRILAQHPHLVQQLRGEDMQARKRKRSFRLSNRMVEPNPDFASRAASTGAPPAFRTPAIVGEARGPGSGRRLSRSPPRRPSPSSRRSTRLRPSFAKSLPSSETPLRATMC
jgi:hypothetical protein